MKLIQLLLLSVLLFLNGIVLGQNWNEITSSLNSNYAEGDSYGNAVSVSGNFAIVGAKKDGGFGTASILKYNNSTNTWDNKQKIVGIAAEKGDDFGCSVSIFGEYAIVGAALEGQNDVNGDPASNYGAAYIYKYNSGFDRWDVKQKLDLGDYRTHYDYFGFSVSIYDGFAIVGAYAEDQDETESNTMDNAGSVFIFEYSSTSDNWFLKQKIVASDRTYGAYFGYSVCMSGDYAVVGSPNNSGGKAYILHKTTNARTGTTLWEEEGVIVSSDIASDDKFGHSVGFSNGTIVVGARLESEDENGANTLNAAGSAYIFQNVSGTWTQIQKLRPKVRAVGDYFGVSVSISGDYVAIGALWEDEDANEQNTLSGAGSAYLFQYDAKVLKWVEKQKVVASDRAAGDYFGCSVALANDTLIVGASGNDVEEDPAQANAGAAYLFYNDLSAAPVELTSFAAKAIGESVVLNWQTATEVNNYGFQVERASIRSKELNYSADEWEMIGFVDGHGNSNSPKEYSFVDTDIPVAERSRSYRLKQIDFDGAFEYHDVVTVELNGTMEYKLAQNHPNPFNPSTQIAFSIPSAGVVKLNIYNVLGEVVTELVNQNLEAGTHQYEFDASNLTSGIYFYSISVASTSSAAGFYEVKKMNLVK